MLTPEQVEGLQVAFEQLAEPITQFLLQDVARRVSEAGQLTSTASYQIWRLQELGKSLTEVEAEVSRILNQQADEARRLFTQVAQVGYNFDLDRLHPEGIPFQENSSIQQMVDAAVALADEKLRNLTQTIGFVAPDGIDYDLTQAYLKTTDYAFTQVFTGAADYNTAIRQACAKLSSQGIRSIDYESGIHTSLEAAIRRDMMGGLGLMTEQISRKNHDDLGADGWEISAHAASAPDHEPIQGKQYSDKKYEALNNSLHRRIGTLNCGHNAFPVILGVNAPQYTRAELNKFREDNAKGVDYEGKHFDTVYDATQYQRRIERSIRAQKRRVLIADNQPNMEAIQQAKIRLNVLRAEYARFCKSTGLRSEEERLWVSGFGKNFSKKQYISSPKYDILKGINLNPLPITKESLSRVQSFSCDALNESMQTKLKNEHKKLLLSVSGKPLGTEAGATYSLQMKPLNKVVGKDGSAKVRIPKENEPYIAIHSHPTDTTFTHTDLNLFARDDYMKILTAVSNNGTVYAVEKTDKFDYTKYWEYYEFISKRHLDYMSSPESYMEFINDILKGIESCGIKYYTGITEKT